jgi:hypothetical protein
MSAPATENHQPPNSSSRLRRLVARRPATAFLVMAFGFGWTSLIPILLSENGFGILPIELPLTMVQTLVGLPTQNLHLTARSNGTTPT